MLTSMPTAPSTSVSSSGLPSPTTDTFDDVSNKLTAYLHQLAGTYEMDSDVIFKDHCYARPWNWKPENAYVKPLKKLFFSKNIASDKYRKDEEIDVENIDSEPLSLPFDLSRVRHMMDEFERLANFARPEEEEEEDWEDKIEKTLWSPTQNRIFTKVTRILSSERLARLAKTNSVTEPIFRRTSVDIAARRFRETLAGTTGWDWRLAQWLHNLLFEHLPQEYLAIYLDILQALRLKIPQLIDKMIAVQPNINSKGGSITWETLGSLLKRSWDPIAQNLNGNRLKKLPGNPILIIVPSGIASAVSSRQHKWITQLGSLGMVATVHTHIGLAVNRMTMMVCMDQLVQATRAKIHDVRNDCPGRPIVLVGFNAGAALACQVAQMEHITAVICIGFPFTTVEGKRGTPDDVLMDIRCPVMFIIGQNATLVRPNDLEELREKMLVETSLVVVGTADDYLRISTSKRILEGITQSMVDRCVLDEIGDFIGSILLQPHPLPLRPVIATNCDNKNKKDSHKRRNSTSSSVESEPNSPTVKKSRPSTPVSSALSVGTNVASSSTSKTGTFSTQANLVQISGQHTNHTSTVKRKRPTNNQRNQFSELKSSKLSAQTNVNSENGITLNIGTLASLAPVGPIRLAPTAVSQATTISSKTSNASKSSAAAVKVPKIISNPLQNVSKMKTMVSSNKSYSNMISNSYRQVSASDKSGDAKLVNVFTTGNQVRVNTTSAGNGKLTATSGTLSNLLQSGKNPLAITSGASATRTSSASSILLTTTNSSTNTITSSISSPSKVIEEMGVSSDSHLLDVSKSAHLPRQGLVSNSTDNSHNTSCGNIVIVENSLHNRGAPSSMIVPFNSQSSGFLSLSNKLKISQKSMKTMPKITVNTTNLQKLQKGKSQSIQKRNIANDIDDDLGNILDIPIIFAKDDDNLSNINKMPVVTQATLAKESQERPKLNSTTKVVLISNKQDKLQQMPNKLGAATQAVICSNMPVQNLNQLILQTRSQNSNISAKSRVGTPLENRLVQPTMKYTKIILAKKNSQPSQQNERDEQMITTKKIMEDINAPKILTFEKNEHRFVQAQSSTHLPASTTNYDDHNIDNVIEIEDVIKKNIIERKYIPAPAIDETSSVTLDDDCNIFNKTKPDENEHDSKQSVFGNVELQT
ncbi:PREDICTED: KAT8 regulatory NSL complex subunit 3 isoform X2 [Trachymyrmex cornetzi]|uniref:KAT8 regulatory NSL complex subunit 3 isoform X2 n=1 Tax=Trachymyrmex cornetzi TaxID=471704 RepID=UPI00084F5107|nr:PREDICTED: KAT8 regulatory NSL complex subunit 3 isoform X2 [Trachymyrmex cornetzi]